MEGNVQCLFSNSLQGNFSTLTDSKGSLCLPSKVNGLVAAAVLYSLLPEK